MPPRPFPLPLGIGIDITQVSRIQRVAFKGHDSGTKVRNLNRFLNRLFTWREKTVFWKKYGCPEAMLQDQSMCLGAAEYLAGRWAAKEAAIKAVPHMNRSFWQVQILRSSAFKEKDATGPIHALLLERPASPFERTHHSDLNGSTAAEQRNVGEITDQVTHAFEYTPGYLQTDDLDGQIAKISISHDGDYATAVCLAADEPRPGDVGGEAAAREP